MHNLFDAGAWVSGLFRHRVERDVVMNHTESIILWSQFCPRFWNKLGPGTPSAITPPYEPCLLHPGDQILAEPDLLFAVQWYFGSIRPGILREHNRMLYEIRSSYAQEVCLEHVPPRIKQVLHHSPLFCGQATTNRDLAISKPLANHLDARGF